MCLNLRKFVATCVLKTVDEIVNFDISSLKH